MQQLTLQYVASVYRRRWLVVLIVVVTTGAMVTKEMVVPSGFTAEKILVISSAKSASSSAAGTLVPDPLSPKVYETLVNSPTVIGQALDRLAAAGFFDDEEEVPDIQDFASDLEVTVEEVDKTTRPINYSPLLILEAKGETEEEAQTIVETWADVAIDTAMRAATMSTDAIGQVLEVQKDKYEAALNNIYDIQEQELVNYDPEMLRRERETVQSLLIEQINAKEDALTELRIHEDRLRLIREELVKTVDLLQETYREDITRIRTDLTAERAEWNLPLLQDQINLRNKLVNEKFAQLEDVKQERAGMETRLTTVREALEKEQPTIQLFRAPSEVAFWMGADKEGMEQALENLRNKGMVSEHLNDMYTFLRNDELNTVTQLAEVQAREIVLEEQLELRKQELEELQRVFAEHTLTQDQLQTDESVSLDLYGANASAKRLELQGLEQSAIMNLDEARSKVEGAEARIKELRTQLEEKQMELAKHKYIQLRLSNEEEAAMSIFKDIERLDDLVVAAQDLTRGDGTSEFQSAGLNPLSDITYATKDRGMLGKKGRVLVVAFMSCGLAVLLALVLEMGPAFLANVRQTGRARKKS